MSQHQLRNSPTSGESAWTSNPAVQPASPPNEIYTFITTPTKRRDGRRAFTFDLRHEVYGLLLFCDGQFFRLVEVADFVEAVPRERLHKAPLIFGNEPLVSFPAAHITAHLIVEAASLSRAHARACACTRSSIDTLAWTGADCELQIIILIVIVVFVVVR